MCSIMQCNDQAFKNMFDAKYLWGKHIESTND